MLYESLNGGIYSSLVPFLLFSGGAWTLELGAIDEATLAAFDARLRAAGLCGVSARSPSGVRVRIEGEA